MTCTWPTCNKHARGGVLCVTHRGRARQFLDGTTATHVARITAEEAAAIDTACAVRSRVARKNPSTRKNPSRRTRCA